MIAGVDVLVIGGGQAGLAASWRLTQAGASHMVIDASDDVGDSWRRRYHSLTLFTPRRLSALPGSPLAGDQDGYAGRIEFADYLQAYAVRNALPVMSGTRVVQLRQGSNLLAQLDNGAQVEARSMIVCTGAFQENIVPAIASGFNSEVMQFTVASYRNPLSVGPGTVLIVGDGASGRDIAVDLIKTHKVVLATGKPRRLFPERILRQSTWTWMDRIGLLSASAKSPVGRIMQAADPFPDRGRGLGMLRMLGIDVRTRLARTEGRTAVFSDGTSVEVDTVIWAVGYRSTDDWIEVDRGSSGLFFLGRPWQRNRASGLILGAGRDSMFVVKKALEAVGQP